MYVIMIIHKQRRKRWTKCIIIVLRLVCGKFYAICLSTRKDPEAGTETRAKRFLEKFETDPFLLYPKTRVNFGLKSSPNPQESEDSR